LAPGRTAAVADRLRDPRWYVVRNAVNVLRHAGDAEALGLLAAAAQHTADAVRREAVWGLVAGGPAALPHLVAAASSPDPSVRKLTVEALGGLTNPEAAEALAGIVRSGGDLATRKLALERLGSSRALGARGVLERLAGSGRALPRALRRRSRALAAGRSEP
jgi:HEAT repeat protein